MLLQFLSFFPPAVFGCKPRRPAWGPIMCPASAAARTKANWNPRSRRRSNMNKEKLKHTLANVGTNIHYAGSSLGSSVKNKLTGHSALSADDELIAGFDHDVKQVIKAMKFLENQQQRMATKYWPYFFKSGTNVAKVFLQLVGEDSLTFKDIEKDYDEFDRLQITSETVLVHPKERQFVIPSNHLELINYLAALDQLQARVVFLADTHSKQLKSKTKALTTHLKHTLKVVKARNKYKDKCAKLEWKTDRLAKKKTPLSNQEQKDLSALQSELNATTNVFSNTNERLKKIAPELMTLVEEFVDDLTKWIVCNQDQITREITDALKYYAVYHGYAKTTSKQNTEDSLATYDEIIDKWETEGTNVRLQVESFIKTIYDKNPDILDKEVDDKDTKLKVSKAWTSLALKVTEKLHTVKAQDLQNGIFSDHMVADPLTSFVKYLDLSMNVSETYHPLKVLDYELVHPDLPQALSPPPLPPRDDNHQIALPVVSPSASTPYATGTSLSSDTLDSIHSDSELSLGSGESDIESDLETELSSLLLSESNNPDRAERQIIKVYNSGKNDITEAPVDYSQWRNLDRYTNRTNVFDDKNTVSYKLQELNNFFQKALANAQEYKETQGKQILVAKKDFVGVEPGDLSFLEGDKIEVVFDLQSVSLSYNEDGRNWFVGATGDADHKRVGFAPNTHF